MRLGFRFRIFGFGVRFGGRVGPFSVFVVVHVLRLRFPSGICVCIVVVEEGFLIT